MDVKDLNLKYLGEEVIECINCGKRSFRVRYYLYEVPYFGTIVLEVGICDECEFRRNDVSAVEISEPARIVVKVKRREDLNALVIKSSKASIMIPELGIEVNPGPAAPGYITTIEGILMNALDIIPLECFDEGSPCYFKVKEIKEAIEGKIPFTLIIEDPTGRSDVRGKGLSITREKLTQS